MSKETTLSDARQKALDAAFAKIEKNFGKGAAMRLGDRPKAEVEAFSTGSITLDNATGIGGFPRGRISEIYAQESVGKTTITLHAIADAQRKGGVAVFVDAEHALDPAYAAKLGVDVENLIISQPDNGEDALEIVETFIRSGVVDILVVDSVAALVPKAELEGEMGDAHMALQARLMSQALRKITGAVSQTNTAVIFINQLRDKIGGMSFGPQTTTTGGKALKFYASLRISMARTGSVKGSGANADKMIANNIKAKIEKNKFAPPFHIALFDIYFGEGISREADLIKLGIDHKVIKKSGSWITYEGDQLGQGGDNARKFLKDNPDLAREIEDKLNAIIKGETLSYENETKSDEEEDAE
jgi:recombination protein RecA